jgi:hypothetical protein
MPNNTILDEAYAAILAHIAALEADKRDDFILAWDYGLGVKFVGTGDAKIVRLYEATSITISGIVPFKVPDNIIDDKGRAPQLLRRDHAIRAYLLSLRWQAHKLKETINQHHAAIAEKFDAFGSLILI